jgi:superfamily II DNA or RNA helicase
MGKELTSQRENNGGASLQDKIAEIWKEPPQVNFPQFFIDKMNLPKFKQDLQDKADKLKARIMQRKEEEGRKKQGAEAQRQREADEVAKQKEEKRAMLSRKLEEKKKAEATNIFARRQKDSNALEEDRRRVNQANNVQLVIPTESRMGTYTKRDSSLVKKHSGLQNNSSFKVMQQAQRIP